MRFLDPRRAFEFYAFNEVVSIGFAARSGATDLEGRRMIKDSHRGSAGLVTTALVCLWATCAASTDSGVPAHEGFDSNALAIVATAPELSDLTPPSLESVPTVPAPIPAAATVLGGGATEQPESDFDAYAMYLSDAPLNLALSVIGRDLGVEFMIETSPRRRVRDVMLEGPPDQVIDDLMSAIGMESFQFNGQVFVSALEDREVRLIRLDGVTPSQAKAALGEAGLLVDRFDIAEVAEGQALVLSGPIKYLAISESIIASLLERDTVAVEPVRVRRAGKLEHLGALSEGRTE